MSCTKEPPLRHDLPTIYAGDTLRAITHAQTLRTSDLVSVRLVITAQGSESPALTLEGGSGITLTATSAPAWEYVMDQIDNVALPAGVYHYSLKTTDSESVTQTYVLGNWQIKSPD